MRNDSSLKPLSSNQASVSTERLEWNGFKASPLCIIGSMTSSGARFASELDGWAVVAKRRCRTLLPKGLDRPMYLQDISDISVPFCILLDEKRAELWSLTKKSLLYPQPLQRTQHEHGWGSRVNIATLTLWSSAGLISSSRQNGHRFHVCIH